MTMYLTEPEAIRVLCLISYYLSHEHISLTSDPAAEGLGEVKLARRISGWWPHLQSHVNLVLEGGQG